MSGQHLPAQGPGRGGAARGYSWPPFEPGNTAAVRHGAHSPRLVRERAQALLERVSEGRPPWLDFVDQAAMWAWCYAEARCELLREWLDEHGQLDEAGQPRDAAKFLLACERRATTERSRLGFDPLARAQLGRDTAIAAAAARQSLDEVAERGRAALEARDE